MAPVAKATGLRRVLEAAAPSLRAAHATGSFTPSAFATPATVAAFALSTERLVVVTATSAEAELLRDGVSALLGPDTEVALWPAWDTHPLERVSPDTAAMAERALLRWRITSGDVPPVLIAPIRALAQILSPEPATEPIVLRFGSSHDRDELLRTLTSFGYRREHLVEHRAEFAVRGGIVDIWPCLLYTSPSPRD